MCFTCFSRNDKNIFVACFFFFINILISVSQLTQGSTNFSISHSLRFLSLSPFHTCSLSLVFSLCQTFSQISLAIFSNWNDLNQKHVLFSFELYNIFALLILYFFLFYIYLFCFLNVLAVVFILFSYFFCCCCRCLQERVRKYSGVFASSTNAPGNFGFSCVFLVLEIVKF